MKKILGPMRKAIEDFNLIDDGDKIGVGVSGGKDSMLLLYALKLYQRFSPEKFELEAFTVDLGFEGFETKAIESYCESIGVPFNLKKTNIKNIVFDTRKEKNPCSLCANMRRGAIHNSLKDRGFNKLALGHHGDDAIDTFFLSLLYEGRINTLPPLTYLDRKKIYIIRPLLYVSEQDIKNSIEKNNIPIVNNPCPADKKTKREDMNKLVHKIYKEVPDARNRILTALNNEKGLRLWFS
ncbi:tRNA lysidine(34) synthetase [Anaerosalibacter massiliensis]|uniref:tRNA 2-thiocytidine(32) synthetase TtcA n=1 Tax=Anaerosalibacter massiliensis TaxID=1347392 RepID=A0A9X2S845_9FIRM|nr:ATP-binding protein [Anaerosalibacter massiliensis]MCR2044716.1 tRNA 2-thiocytidine(32) synthetase TtcA [Anaerosalibacter massiliensis]